MRLEHGFISPSLSHEFGEGFTVSKYGNDSIHEGRFLESHMIKILPHSTMHSWALEAE